MYAAVRRYKFNPKDAAEIDRRVREVFVPMMKKTAGFVAYYWLEDGAGNGASMSVFKDKAGADESIREAAEFVKESFADIFVGAPEVVEGHVEAYA